MIDVTNAFKYWGCIPPANFFMVRYRCEVFATLNVRDSL